MWFQILGFILLVSPLQSKALSDIRNSKSNSKHLFGLFIVFLNSTLTGQIAGSLTFELVSWPIIIGDAASWKGLWQLLAWLYPIERVIVTLSSTFIGALLFEVLANADLISIPDRPKKKKNAWSFSS
jgi:hypothetical protein